MHQIHVSLIGVSVSDVRVVTTESGHKMARFRLVCRPRRFDAATGTFTEHDPSFVSVLCWRQLAEHVSASVHKGDQVVVTGRLRVREWEQEGRTRVSVEVDAQSVGLDLTRAPALLQRHTLVPASATSSSATPTPPAEVATSEPTTVASGETASRATHEPTTVATHGPTEASTVTAA